MSSPRSRMSILCEAYVMGGGSDEDLHRRLREVAEEYRGLSKKQRQMVRVQMRGGAHGTVVGERRNDLRELFRSIDA